MRVEWKTFDASEKTTHTVNFPYQVLFFILVDTRLKIARVGRLSKTVWKDSIREQLIYLLKQFKLEGSSPRTLVVKIIGENLNDSSTQEFIKTFESFGLKPEQRQLRAQSFRFSLLTGELWAKTEIATPSIRPSPQPPAPSKTHSALKVTDARLLPEHRPELLNRRVLIIEDSPPIQKLLQRLYSQVPGLSVIGAADSVSEAIQLMRMEKVDIVSLDLKLKDGTGIDFLKELKLISAPSQMRMNCILVTDCSPAEGSLVLDAMALGATAYLQKPQVNDMSQFTEELKTLIEDMVGRLEPKQIECPRLAPTNLDPFDLIAIGSSTGGTEVVADLIRRLPQNCPPILVVQHMPPHFTKLYAERITKQTGRETIEIQDEHEVRPGRAYIAAGGFHMTVKKTGSLLKVRKVEGAAVNRFKPSVSVLFKSIVDQKLAPKTLAVMLTGMGSDGAKEMLALRQAGAITIGQSRDSCAVYGMPRAAAEIGALTFVASPEEMIAKLRCADSRGDSGMQAS